jgi:hypothetical protein
MLNKVFLMGKVADLKVTYSRLQDAAWFVRFPSAATRVGEVMPVQTGQSYSRFV